MQTKSYSCSYFYWIGGKKTQTFHVLENDFLIFQQRCTYKIHKAVFSPFATDDHKAGKQDNDLLCKLKTFSVFEKFACETKTLNPIKWTKSHPSVFPAVPCCKITSARSYGSFFVFSCCCCYNAVDETWDLAGLNRMGQTEHSRRFVISKLAGERVVFAGQ